MIDEWEKDLQIELEDPEFAKSYGAECATSGFGLTLLHARQKQKLTQQQLSDRLGIRQPYIAQLESGEANTTLRSAGKILASLGLKLVITTVPLKQKYFVPDDEAAIKQPSLIAEQKAKYAKSKKTRE